MSARWVCNASPIIALGRVGQLHLLTDLCGEILVPAGVAAEIRAGREECPASAWIRAAGTPHVRKIDGIDPAVGAWDLGAGETEVLSWARAHPDYEAILDDYAARRCAAAFGIAVRGTLGVLLLAKRAGIIPVVGPVLDRLGQVGFRTHPTLRAQIVAEAGE